MRTDFDLTFVTCSKLPDLDPDDAACLSILKERGWRCGIAVWNDPTVQWEQSGMTVLRCTWDYHLQVREFVSWAERVQARLVNRFSLVRWNSNKRYLVELQNRGISIIPTIVIDSAAAHNEILTRDSLISTGWQDAIVKPAVGLSTYGVERFDSLASQLTAAVQHVAKLGKENDVLIQQYMPAVSEYGERALMFFAGNFSHSIRKTPFQKHGIAGAAGETAVQASKQEVAFGRAVLATLPEVPLYARVDVVPDAGGNLMLMELELIEPSMFLRFDAGAATRFADAIEQRLLATGSVPAAIAISG